MMLTDEQLVWMQVEEEEVRWGSSARQDLANQLEERLIDLAVRVINLTNALPSTPAGRHISNQILRSATSPAPNYGEARGAESRADFIHKLGIVCKELNETCIWLRIIKKSEMLSESRIGELLDECEQLCRILARSRATLRARENEK